MGQIGMFVESLWLSVTLRVLSGLEWMAAPRGHFGILLQWIGVNSPGPFFFIEGGFLSMV